MSVIWLCECEIGPKGGMPLEPATISNYESETRLHINPLIGEIKLNQLDRETIKYFRTELLNSRSRTLAKRVVRTLTTMLNIALDKKMIAYNPAIGVIVRDDGRYEEELTIPSKHQIKELFETAAIYPIDSKSTDVRSHNRYYAIFLTLALSGIRISELRGLKWTNVSFSKGTIKIQQRADNKSNTIGPPKTKHARRTVQIPTKLVACLKDWRMHCPDGDLVFPNWQGNIESYSNIRNRGWLPICERAGLCTISYRLKHGKKKKHIETWFCIHSLRHFHASMLIASGASPLEIKKEMGHSSIDVTYQFYGHLFPEDDKKRAERSNSMCMEVFG